MRTLFAAFGGRTNSSQALLDAIDSAPEDKLYLKNSFKSSPAQLREQISSDAYDLILLFGQYKAPSANTICLETVGRNNRVAYHTEVNFPEFAQRLAHSGFDPVISKDAGRYLCNNIYFESLKFIDEHSLKAKAIFIHIPKLRQRPDLTQLAATITSNLDRKLLLDPDPL